LAFSSPINANSYRRISVDLVRTRNNHHNNSNNNKHEVVTLDMNCEVTELQKLTKDQLISKLQQVQDLLYKEQKARSNLEVCNSLLQKELSTLKKVLEDESRAKGALRVEAETLRDDTVKLQKQYQDLSDKLNYRSSVSFDGKSTESLQEELLELRWRLRAETEKFKTLQKEKDAAYAEIEDLTRSLFEESNKLVSDEARKVAELEKSKEKLEKELEEMTRRLELESAVCSMLKERISKIDELEKNQSRRILTIGDESVFGSGERRHAHLETVLSAPSTPRVIASSSLSSFSVYQCQMSSSRTAISRSYSSDYKVHIPSRHLIEVENTSSSLLHSEHRVGNIHDENKTRNENDNSGLSDPKNFPPLWNSSSLSELSLAQFPSENVQSENVSASVSHVQQQPTDTNLLSDESSNEGSSSSNSSNPSLSSSCSEYNGIQQQLNSAIHSQNSLLQSLSEDFPPRNEKDPSFISHQPQQPYSNSASLDSLANEMLLVFPQTFDQRSLREFEQFLSVKFDSKMSGSCLYGDRLFHQDIKPCLMFPKQDRISIDIHSDGRASSTVAVSIGTNTQNDITKQTTKKVHVKDEFIKEIDSALIENRCYVELISSSLFQQSSKRLPTASNANKEEFLSSKSLPNANLLCVLCGSNQDCRYMIWLQHQPFKARPSHHQRSASSPSISFPFETAGKWNGIGNSANVSTSNVSSSYCGVKEKYKKKPSPYDGRTICQRCRDRIVTVGDFYTFLRNIQSGIVKWSLEEMFYECLKLRMRMNLSRVVSS